MDPNDMQGAGAPTAPPPPAPGDVAPGDAMDTGGAMDMCVPLDTLKEPDAKDMMNAPDVGDNVVMTVEGTISRIEGTNAYITPSAVNGQKLDQAQGAPPSESDQLRGMAAQQPNY